MSGDHVTWLTWPPLPSCDQLKLAHCFTSLAQIAAELSCEEWTLDTAAQPPRAAQHYLCVIKIIDAKYEFQPDGSFNITLTTIKYICVFCISNFYMPTTAKVLRNYINYKVKAGNI